MESITTTAADTSTILSAISFSDFLHESESLSRPYQTENRLEVLQAWLLKMHNQLQFLFQIEGSVSLAHIVAALDKKLQPQVNEKDIIEFLLAINDFATEEKNLALPTQFFIKRTLKTQQLLMDSYSDCYAKLYTLKDTVDLSNSPEDLKQLQDKLLDLKKEKKQLQKSLLPDFELTHLIELTSNLEKFRPEQDRNSLYEIAKYENKLKLHTQELNIINKGLENIEKELTFSIDQFETI